MYSSFPPQEGNDPKLSSIMAARPPSAAVASRPNFPPHVGRDPKLLACMNIGDAAIASSSSQANLGVAAASVPSHQKQENHDAAPPSKESIANSLLSFKQTSPTMAMKADANSGSMADFCSIKPNPADSLTNFEQQNDFPIHPAAEPGIINNSNFWLQEEEERFLLGLRMYGWGQWKRIQPIVKTRTNKQIKSHAQKREKVNPEIKIKYSKGTCRRGRISSGVLANDARILSTSGDDLMAAIEHDDQHHFPPLEQMVKDVYQTNNGDGPNSRVRRYRHTPYHHSSYRPHPVHGKSSVPQEQLCKEASYTPGMEVYTRLSDGKWAIGIIKSSVNSGPTQLYHIQYHGEGENSSIPEDLIMSKTRYDEMISELEGKFELPDYAQITRSHPLPGGTPVYAQWMNRLDPNAHARWISGTVNSCVKEEDVYRYHILFDNDEEAHYLLEKNVLHRLDYDNWLNANS